LDLWWQSLHFRYTGHNETIFPVNNNADAYSVRDAFMFSVNLPALGTLVAGMIKKVSGING
jgi:hypothetical protein